MEAVWTKRWWESPGNLLCASGALATQPTGAHMSHMCSGKRLPCVDCITPTAELSQTHHTDCATPPSQAIIGLMVAMITRLTAQSPLQASPCYRVWGLPDARLSQSSSSTKNKRSGQKKVRVFFSNYLKCVVTVSKNDRYWTFK